jgi:hypothetical protein
MQNYLRVSTWKSGLAYSAQSLPGLVYGEHIGSTKVVISTCVDTWYVSTQAFLICRRENT